MRMKKVAYLVFIHFRMHKHKYHLLTLLKMVGRGGKNAPLPVFSPVTSTGVELSPKNFLTFSLNSFATLKF